MITALVEFPLPAPISRQQARDLFLSTAPRYQGLAGLLHKAYIVSEDGSRAGGVYLWASKAAAAAVYTPAWREFVRSKYGSEPQLTYFESPVVVDNRSGDLLTDERAPE